MGGWSAMGWFPQDKRHNRGREGVVRKVASSFLVFYLLLCEEPGEGDDVGVNLLPLCRTPV